MLMMLMATISRFPEEENMISYTSSPVCDAMHSDLNVNDTGRTNLAENAKNADGADEADEWVSQSHSSAPESFVRPRVIRPPQGHSSA